MTMILKYTSISLSVLMSIDNLYFIRVCAERISLEMKSRPVYSVSSLPRPFSKREKGKGEGSKAWKYTSSSKHTNVSSYSFPPLYRRHDFNSLLPELITFPETFIVTSSKRRGEFQVELRQFHRNVESPEIELDIELEHRYFFKKLLFGIVAEDPFCRCVQQLSWILTNVTIVAWNNWDFQLSYSNILKQPFHSIHLRES